MAPNGFGNNPWPPVHSSIHTKRPHFDCVGGVLRDDRPPTLKAAFLELHFNGPLRFRTLCLLLNDRYLPFGGSQMRVAERQCRLVKLIDDIDNTPLDVAEYEKKLAEAQTTVDDIEDAPIWPLKGGHTPAALLI